MIKTLPASGKTGPGEQLAAVQGPWKPHSTPTGVKMTCSSAVSVTTSLTIPWTQTLFDFVGFKTASPATILYVPATGWYAISAYVRIATVADHYGSLAIYHTSGALVAMSKHFLSTAGSALSVTGTRYARGNASEGFYVVWTSNSVAVTSQAGEGGLGFSVWRVA